MINVNIYLCLLTGRRNSHKSRERSSDTSSISTSDIENIVDRLKGQQHHDSTRQNYYRVWKLFNSFFLRLDVKPLTWDHRIVLFVGYLIDKGKKSTTIRCYLSAIRAVLKTESIEFSEDTYLLNALTRACKLKNDVVSARLPIGRSMLELLLKKLDVLLANQPYLLTMYRALFLTTYTGLFRIGEVTASPHALKAKDVGIGKNKDKLRFLLRSSKTHTPGDRPQVIKISKEKTEKTEMSCPFMAVNNYLAI